MWFQNLGGYTTAGDVDIIFSSPANGGKGYTLLGNSATTASLQGVAQCFDNPPFHMLGLNTYIYLSMSILNEYFISYKTTS